MTTTTTTRPRSSERPASRPVRDDFPLEHNGELLRKVAKGDDRAWAELIGRFGTMVFRIAQSNGLNAASAADVQQSTWAQLMQCADQVRDPERIAGWLATTARRKSQRMAMNGARHTLCPDPVGQGASVDNYVNSVEALALREQYDPALARALDRIPPRYRQVLLLLSSDWTPTYDEVAKIMGLPKGSIGPMRLRALHLLRQDPELQRCK